MTNWEKIAELRRQQVKMHRDNSVLLFIVACVFIVIFLVLLIIPSRASAEGKAGQFWWWSPDIAKFCEGRALFSEPQPSVLVWTADPKNISEPIREGSPKYSCDIDICTGTPVFCAKVDR